MRRFMFFALMMSTALQAIPRLAAQEQPNNAVLSHLIDKGISAGDVTLKIGSPVMGNGLDAAAQRKAIESIAEGNKTYDALVKKGLAAPFIYKLQSSGTLRKVDVYFVAYGDLNYLMEEGFHDFKLINASDPVLKSDVIELDDATLKSRGIVRQDEREMYYHAYLPLLEAVQIKATVHAIDTRTDDSLLIASIVDERFAKDAKYPNSWRKIVEQPDGTRKLDATSHPYSGAGVVAKATQLQAPKGAIFVEYHLVFNEPQGWFNGAKVLPARLPLATQDSIRKLRVQLEKEEKRSAGKKPAPAKQ